MLERKFFMAFVPYGITPPIITPFNDDGSVNYEVLAMMSRRLVDGGVHGLFPLGTTGEFYAVSDDEFVKILTTVKEAVAGRTTRKGRPIQLFAGCNHITTRGVIHLIKLVEQVGGYDAVSVLTPMFISQTQDELYTYYKTIADSTAMPVILYNNKPKTNVTIAPQTVARLARACSHIVAVKDSTRDMAHAEEDLRLAAGQRDHFNVLMGRDTMIFAALMYGATGAIASCANVAPRITADIYDKWEDGDLAGALAAQYKLAPLRIATNMGTFPQTIKEALVMQGLPVGKCLDPIQELSPAQKETLRGVLQQMELI